MGILLATLCLTFAVLFLPASNSSAGRSDGIWDADVEVVTWNNRRFSFNGEIEIIDNHFDSKIDAKNGDYNFLKGDILGSSSVQGYFMWGMKTWSIKFRQANLLPLVQR
tara:strand:- start:158 stop:484 length:327 start_codon:yes stop_codon:yes gene_type:complete